MSERATHRFGHLVVRFRHVIAAGLALATLFFLYPTVNAISTALEAMTPETRRRLGVIAERYLGTAAP